MPAHLLSGALRALPIDRLRTRYAHLRPGSPRPAFASDPTPLPIRVVPIDDGSFEVIDGFKRLALARECQARELLV